MKVVIVTYNWPPRNAIGTHRPYSWARYWSEAGVEVTVLTAQKHQFDAPLDLNLPELPNVNVIQVPYGRVAGASNFLVKHELARQILRKIKAKIVALSGCSIDQRNAWWPAANEVSLKLAKQADVVVSTYGPATAHLIAKDMKCENPRLRWVADYRDLWSQAPSSALSVAEVKKREQIELRTVGTYADVITAVSKDMVEKLSALSGKEAVHIPNGFDLDEEKLQCRLQRICLTPKKPFRIVYTGMLYEGYQDPTPVLNALVALKGAGRLSDEEVTIDFYGSRVSVARQLAGKNKYRPFIRLMGHVPREDALKAQQSADLLLLLESPAPEARGVLTGKLFEYIVAGKPILCVGSRPEYEIGRVLEKTGTGQVFGPDEYARLGDVILATMNGQGLYVHYGPTAEQILKYSRKNLASRMLKVVLDGCQKGASPDLFI